MAQSSILGGNPPSNVPPGHDIDSLGPSDSSDSGSDVQGEREHPHADPASEGAVPAAGRSDTDAAGTGERGSATGTVDRDSGDIRPDRVRRVTDKELAEADLDERLDIDPDELVAPDDEEAPDDQVDAD